LVQQWFHTNYGEEAPTKKLIFRQHKSFAETGCTCAKQNISGRGPSGKTWSVFVRRFSIVHKVRKREIWRCFSHDSLEGVFTVVHISTAAGVEFQ
jgi:hypothetical protein